MEVWEASYEDLPSLHRFYLQVKRPFLSTASSCGTISKSSPREATAVSLIELSSHQKTNIKYLHLYNSYRASECFTSVNAVTRYDTASRRYDTARRFLARHHNITGRAVVAFTESSPQSTATHYDDRHSDYPIATCERLRPDQPRYLQRVPLGRTYTLRTEKSGKLDSAN